jgi:Flp pilus assembly protein TadG
MNRFRSERGQAMVLTTLFIVALLGMAALVLDLGTWFRSQRDLQAVADAAALAGAQEQPDSTAPVS